MLRLSIRSFLLALLVGVSTASANAGAPFPDLIDIDGNAVTDQADVGDGEWQVVMIWATNCHVCAEMKPKLSAFHDKYKDSGTKVYGIALDGHARTKQVKQYMIDHKVTFPTYIGELDLIAMNFELNSEAPLTGTPTYMVFTPTGELIAIDYGMLNIEALEKFIARNS